MPALSLRYDHCSLRKPRYLNKLAIETVAREARAQLLPPGAEALTLEQLAAISDLTINGLPYQLWVSLDHPVTDEDGLPVLGLCEFDPDCGEDAVSVLVSPVGEQLTPELALSTFAHELGHKNRGQTTVFCRCPCPSAGCRYPHLSRERLREAVEVVRVGLGPACSPSLHESVQPCLEMHPFLSQF